MCECAVCLGMNVLTFMMSLMILIVHKNRTTMGKNAIADLTEFETFLNARSALSAGCVLIVATDAAAAAIALQFLLLLWSPSLPLPPPPPPYPHRSFDFQYKHHLYNRFTVDCHSNLNSFIHSFILFRLSRKCVPFMVYRSSVYASFLTIQMVLIRLNSVSSGFLLSIFSSFVDFFFLALSLSRVSRMNMSIYSKSNHRQFRITLS